MKKLAIWYWEGDGPTPTSLGYRQANMVSESPDRSFADHRRRAEEMARNLDAGDHLIINCEQYGKDNAVNAIGLVSAVRSVNRGVYIGAYVPQANGDRWGICAKIDNPRDNALACQSVTETLDQLAPWVDFWCVDCFEAENSKGDPITFSGMTPEATSELIRATRVAMLESYSKPWWGFCGATVVPGKRRDRNVVLPPDRFRQVAHWCRLRGADALLAMVWDDSRKAKEGTGVVAPSAAIIKDLRLAAQL